MGQDRKFTEEETALAFKAVTHYAKKWTEREAANLKKDIQLKIEMTNQDKEFLEKGKARFEDVTERWIAERIQDDEVLLEKAREQFNNDKWIFEYTQENQKNYYLREYKIKILSGEKIEVRPESPPEVKAKDDKKGRPGRRDQKHDESKDDSNILPEEEIDYTFKWRNDFMNFKNFRVIKYPRVLQSLLYLLCYNREDICEEGTNKLCWKKAKKYIDLNLFVKIKEYVIFGPKNEVKEYQKINFILKNLEDYKLEDVESYSLLFGQIIKYIKITCQLRRADVIKRKLLNNKLKEERAKATEEENERLNERAVYLEEEINRIKAERAEKLKAKEGEGEGEEDEEAEGEGHKAQEEEINEAEILAKFDTEHAPIHIPPEVPEEIDADVELTDEDLMPATD